MSYDLEQVRRDHGRIVNSHEQTVREWLHDVERRPDVREAWEDEALNRVLSRLIAVADEAREVVRYADDEAHERLHRAVRFLSTPVGWLRDD